MVEEATAKSLTMDVSQLPVASLTASIVCLAVQEAIFVSLRSSFLRRGGPRGCAASCLLFSLRVRVLPCCFFLGVGGWAGGCGWVFFFSRLLSLLASFRLPVLACVVS